MMPGTLMTYELRLDSKSSDSESDLPKIRDSRLRPPTLPGVTAPSLEIARLDLAT